MKKTFSERIGKIRTEAEIYITNKVKENNNYIQFFDFTAEDWVDDSYGDLPQINETSRHGFSLNYYVWVVKLSDDRLLFTGYEMEDGDNEEFLIDYLSTTQLAYLIDYHLNK